MNQPGIRYAPIIVTDTGQSIIIWYHYDTPDEAKECAAKYVEIGLGRNYGVQQVFVPQFVHGC